MGFIGKDLLIYDITKSAFWFVSHRVRKPDDRVVEARRGEPMDRSFFKIEQADNGHYKIHCPAYHNRYLFCSWDKENNHHLVEARVGADDDRMRFDITEIDGKSGEYRIYCVKTETFPYVSNDQDEDDFYVEHSKEVLGTVMFLTVNTGQHPVPVRE